MLIWLAVLPMLTVPKLALGWLSSLPTVPRGAVLGTIAVPVVVRGLLPSLHRLRAVLLSRSGPRL